MGCSLVLYLIYQQSAMAAWKHYRLQSGRYYCNITGGRKYQGAHDPHITTIVLKKIQ